MRLSRFCRGFEIFYLQTIIAFWLLSSISSHMCSLPYSWKQHSFLLCNFAHLFQLLDCLTGRHCDGFHLFTPRWLDLWVVSLQQFQCRTTWVSDRWQRGRWSQDRIVSISWLIVTVLVLHFSSAVRHSKFITLVCDSNRRQLSLVLVSPLWSTCR